MTTAKNRVQQGIRALLAVFTSVDDTLANQYLNPQQRHAFHRMSRAEQLHSLNVLRAVLQQADETPHALAVAALLHDVGKSRYHLAVWQKTLSVLVKAFLPPLFTYLSRDETINLWRAPFTVRKYHPKWSGQILRECSSSDVAVWLAEHHQDTHDIHQSHPHYPLLIRLQHADDAN